MTASARAGVSLRVDTTLYPISAITRAAYKFTAKHHVAIRRVADDDTGVMVTLTPKRPWQAAARGAEKAEGADGRDAANGADEADGADGAEDALIGDFGNELIDQRLRETLEAEFGALRELIVAHAFSDTNLLDPARDDGDYIDDPLRIGLSGPQSTATVPVISSSISAPIPTATTTGVSATISPASSPMTSLAASKVQSNMTSNERTRT